MEAAPSPYERWRAERTARGQDVMRSAQRHYAAIAGWDRIATQADWDRLRDQTVEDWENGTQLLKMLGTMRYVEPERAALCLTLWDDFRATYQPTGPAEYLVIAMAILSFDHFLRINGIIHNIQGRIEAEFFSLDGLHTDRDPHAFSRLKSGLTVSQVVEQLGLDMLPLLDRLNRLVIRNLRTLRELKTTPLNLNVANFGQLNVGQTQTNVGTPGRPDGNTRRQPEAPTARARRTASMG